MVLGFMGVNSLRGVSLTLWDDGAVAGQDSGPTLPDRDAGANVLWHAILAGDTKNTPVLVRLRRIFRHLPSDPRCKLCYAPYAPPFGPVVGMLGFGRWSKNPT